MTPPPRSVSLTSRPVLGSPAVDARTGMSSALAGLLTAIPFLCMGVFAVAGPVINGLGTRQTVEVRSRLRFVCGKQARPSAFGEAPRSYVSDRASGGPRTFMPAALASVLKESAIRVSSGSSAARSKKRSMPGDAGVKANRIRA